MKKGLIVGMLVILASLLIASTASAGVIDSIEPIAVTCFEKQTVSAGIAARIPFDSDGNVSGLLIEKGKKNLDGNAAEQVLGCLMVATGYGIQHGGAYGILRGASYGADGLRGEVSADLRLGLGANIGPVNNRLHIAVYTRPQFDLLGVMVGWPLLAN